MGNISKIGWCGALVMALSGSGAYALDLKCPPQPHSDQRARASGDGWEVIAISGTDGLRSLAGVQFFENHPSQMASLVPDESRETKAKSSNVWNFDPRSSGDIWFACAYGKNGALLARRLTAGLSRCEVVYSKGFAQVESVSCR